jgi:hypothetical protein
MKDSTEFYRSLKKDWKITGKCVDCGAEVMTLDGKPTKKCEKHIQRDRECHKNKANRRAALCQCTQCGVKIPTATAFVRETCSNCKLINNNKKKKSYAQQK